jgi:hypothetical protein
VTKLTKRILGCGAATLITVGLMPLLGATGGPAEKGKETPKSEAKKDEPKADAKKKPPKGSDKTYTSPDWWKPGEKGKADSKAEKTKK